MHRQQGAGGAPQRLQRIGHTELEGRRQLRWAQPDALPWRQQLSSRNHCQSSLPHTLCKWARWESVAWISEGKLVG